jgi:hypothetical protein
MTRKKPVRIKKGKKMDSLDNTGTPAQDVAVSKKDMKNQGVFEVRAEQGATGKLILFFRHPVLADVIDKMAVANYPKADFDKIYRPILMDHPNPEAAKQGRVATRPAIYSATKNFEAAADFSFTAPPRGILIANPAALRTGFELTVELTQPVPPDTLRKWGKQFMDGCADIIAASRPFKMSWVMTEQPLGKL